MNSNISKESNLSIAKLSELYYLDIFYSSVLLLYVNNSHFHFQGIPPFERQGMKAQTESGNVFSSQ